MTTLTADQIAASRQRALGIANRRRAAMANLLREIHVLPEAEARALVVAILDAPDETACALPVRRLLTAIRDFGHGTARRVLTMAGVVSSDRRIGELTPRQRQVMREVLADPRRISPHTRRPTLDLPTKIGGGR